MTCSGCGNSIGGGAAFCIECGARVTEPQVPVAACVSCGAEVGTDVKFCTKCGVSVADTWLPDAVAPPVDPAVADTMLRRSTPALAPTKTQAAAVTPPIYAPRRRRKRSLISAVLIGVGVLVLVAAAFAGSYVVVDRFF